MPVDDNQKRLIDIWQNLPTQQAAQLLEFADFLQQRHATVISEIAEPLDIPRPEKESVPSALKRLTKTYPMLSSRLLLDDASKFMTQHLMEGRPSNEVIDDIEVMFRQHYENLINDN